MHVLLCLAALWGAGSVALEAAPPVRRSAPHAGFAYPAGAQVGTTTRIAVGGQNLRNVVGIHIDGDGVQANVVRWLPPPRPLDRKQRQALRDRLIAARERLLGDGETAAEPQGEAGDAPESAEESAAALPRHPLLDHLEEMNLEELAGVARYFTRRRNPLQRKRSIEETVQAEITVDAGARPGARELRVETRTGLSEPLRFEVGLLPERREPLPALESLLRRRGTARKPAARKGTARRAGSGADRISVKGEAAPLELPVVVNGQILPREVDRFRFRATRGLHLVARAHARLLVPFQADSVPGWMQAVLTLRDEAGRELACADDYRFDPDPVLLATIPRDGIYTLEVRDALARGREDFVYRVELGELPHITSVFPLGGTAGASMPAHVTGWNLDRERVDLAAAAARGDAPVARPWFRWLAWCQGELPTNRVAFEVDATRSVTEVEGPGDDDDEEPIQALPVVVDGRIGLPGDRDGMRFVGRAGDEVVAEVHARVLGSPLDSVITLLDERGEVVAWNDDDSQQGGGVTPLGVRGVGLATDHADSALSARLPRDGSYTVRIADARGHGGEEYAYRLHVRRARPDVELFAVPSSLAIPAGRAALVEVRALRRGGFTGPVELALADSPPGFRLHGAILPAGRDRVRFTITAPRRRLDRPVELRLVGRFAAPDPQATPSPAERPTPEGTEEGPQTDERERPVQPADDVVQAFLWRHLRPAHALTAVVTAAGRWRGRGTIAPANARAVVVAPGGRAPLRFSVRGRLPLDRLAFGLVDPPDGVRLGAAARGDDGLELELVASESARVDPAPENLIVEVFILREVPGGKRAGGKGKARRRVRRIPAGVLPAIVWRIDPPLDRAGSRATDDAVDLGPHELR